MAPTLNTTALATAEAALTTAITHLTDPPTLTARAAHHTPDPASPPRSDATMSDAARALKLRNLTIGWTLGIVGAVILIGITIFCVVGKRRCGLARRERDPSGFDARVAGGSVPRAEDFDTRSDAEIRDARRWEERAERDRVRRERDEEMQAEVAEWREVQAVDATVAAAGVGGVGGVNGGE